MARTHRGRMLRKLHVRSSNVSSRVVSLTSSSNAAALCPLYAKCNPPGLHPALVNDLEPATGSQPWIHSTFRR